MKQIVNEGSLIQKTASREHLVIVIDFSHSFAAEIGTPLAIDLIHALDLSLDWPIRNLPIVEFLGINPATGVNYRL